VPHAVPSPYVVPYTVLPAGYSREATLEAAGLSAPAERHYTDLSVLSFEESNELLKSVASIHFSGHGDVLRNAAQALWSLALERTMSFKTKRAERAIESAIKMGERKRLRHNPVVHHSFRSGSAA
jgi:hypothetical protein